MSTNPLVSDLMDVYNGYRYLKEAIDSVLSQTFENYEFNKINDGRKLLKINDTFGSQADGDRLAIN